MEPDDEGRPGGSDARDTRRVARRLPGTDAPADEVGGTGPVAGPARRRPVPTGPVPVPWRRAEGAPARSVSAHHRLRDLGPTGRVVVVAVVLLLVLPGLVGLFRFERAGWVLNSDNALLGLRSLDVTGGDPPLTGQPSTSETAGGGIRTYHPGPIQMWAFAPLTRALGGWGFEIGGVVVNLAAVLTAAWVAFRRLGPAGGLTAAVLLGLLLRSVQVYLLTDPVSSNMWGLALVALAMCAWAVLDGDHRLLPLTAAWASWAGQQHLSAVGPTAALTVVALAGFVVIVISARRRHEGVPDRAWRWFAASAGVGLLLWLPVIIQQLTGDPGNITAVVEYAGVEGRTTFGLSGAFHLLIRSLEPVPVLLRTSVNGTQLATEPGLVGWTVGVVVLALAVAVLASPGVARRARLLVATGLALAPVGVFNAANIPGNTIEVLRINLHRWVWPFSSFVVIGVVWAGVDLLVRRAEASGRAELVRARTAAITPERAVLGAVGLTALLIGATLIQPDAKDVTRDPYSSQVIRAVDDVVLDDMGDADRVLLIPIGAGAEFSVVPALTFQLERKGVHVEVPDRLGPYTGERVDKGDWDAAYVITSTEARVTRAPGRLLADLLVDGRLVAPIERLSAGLRGSRPSVNRDGSATIDEFGLDPLGELGFRLQIEGLASDPVSGLLDPRIVDVLDGGVDGVSIDAQALAELDGLLAERHEVWSNRRFFVLRVEAGEVANLLEQEVPGQ